MGFFVKNCSICNGEIILMSGNKLSDGYYCKKCAMKLSPFFAHDKKLTKRDIAYQLECRHQNELLYKNFKISKTIGLENKLLFDDSQNAFIIALDDKNFKKHTPDVIFLSQITNCCVDIVEERKEVYYSDSNDDIKSFNPPYFAHSFDFYLVINVSIPYIDTIRFKVNKDVIDNGQEEVIDLSGGLLQKIADKFASAKSYNGKTSNIEEVKASSEYQKYERISNEMCNTLIENKNREILNKKQTCPWCGNKNIATSTGFCPNCGGQLNP